MKNITTIPLTLLALACLQANATPTTTTPPTAVTAAGTGYHALVGDSHIYLGEAMAPVQMADMLLCVVSASGAPLLPNETYQAIADFGLCGAASGESTQANYSSMTVESSRASADVAQVANMWIDLNDGPSEPVKDVHFRAELSSAPTDTNHLGVWQLGWEFQNPAGPNSENGHAQAVNGTGGFAELTMASNSAEPGDTANDVYAKFAMTSLTEGGGRVTSSADGDFTLAFNDNFVKIEKDGEDPTCQSLANFSDVVYEYNLYDSSGALVDINAEIEFTTAAGNSGALGQYSYWDGSSEQISYWVWIEDNGYPITDGATTVSDSTTPATKYTITWDITGSGSTAYQTVMAVADGASAGGSAHVFDKPIIFDTSSAAALATTVSPLTDRNDNTDTITTADLSSQLMYNGPGRLWGFDWDSNKPKAALADGTALLSKATGNHADHTSKKYYVKAATVEKTPVDIPLDNCDELSESFGSASALGLPTVADITNNPVTLGTKPVVRGVPKIKDGVLTN